MFRHKIPKRREIFGVMMKAKILGEDEFEEEYLDDEDYYDEEEEEEIMV